jgi:hypothetical protein
MSKVLTSRRFWSLIVSQVVAIILFVVTNYVPDPKVVELAKLIIVGVDSVAGVIIAAYTIDDITSNVAAIKAGSHPDYQIAPKS